MTIDFSKHTDVQLSQEIISTARLLRAEGINSEPAILRTYLFPANEEVRLIHVDKTIARLPDGEAIAPFYFKAVPELGIAVPSAIALIAPEDELSAPLPNGWDWESATLVEDPR
ncbi:MAG: hypothetical protein LC772_08640 [Chloroflexi bacterium]|nr:hypothetical protein [Chloroflexota bacterium]